MCKKQKDREKNTTALFPPMSKHKGVEPAVLISASKIDGGLSGQFIKMFKFAATAKANLHEIYKKI